MAENDRCDKMLEYWNQRHRDIRLTIRALSSGWPISDDLKRLILENAEIFLRRAISEGDKRTFAALSRLQLEFDRQNVERMKLALTAEKLRLGDELSGRKVVDAEEVPSIESQFAEIALEMSSFELKEGEVPLESFCSEDLPES